MKVWFSHGIIFSMAWTRTKAIGTWLFKNTIGLLQPKPIKLTDVRSLIRSAKESAEQILLTKFIKSSDAEVREKAFKSLKRIYKAELSDFLSTNISQRNGEIIEARIKQKAFNKFEGACQIYMDRARIILENYNYKENPKLFEQLEAKELKALSEIYYVLSEDLKMWILTSVGALVYARKLLQNTEWNNDFGFACLDAATFFKDLYLKKCK